MRSSMSHGVVLVMCLCTSGLLFLLCVSASVSPSDETIPYAHHGTQLYSSTEDRPTPTPVPEEWVPYVPSDQQTEIIVWASESINYAIATITFSQGGYRVADWGGVERTGDTFSVDSKIEMWTGPAPQIITVESNNYALDVLTPGSYEFIFKSWGQEVTRVPCAVSACVIETNSVSLTPGDDFTLAIRLKQNIEQPFDLYLIMEAFSKTYSIYPNGTLEPGIEPAATHIPGYHAPYFKTMLPHVTVPTPSVPVETVTFYLAMVEAGTMPPAARLSEIASDTRHVIAFDKQTVSIRAAS